MSTSSQEHIVIIGNGISGISAARWIRKSSNHRITVISSESDHFFSRTALMYIYMGHMDFKSTKPYEDWFWKKNRIDLKRGYVDHIDFENKQLRFAASFDTLKYDKLILALGSKPNKFGWPGQDLEGVQGLYSLQDLENLETWSDQIEHGVIVGGGLIGIELAEMLLSRNKKVSLVVRESSYWNNVLPEPESQMINKHILEHGVNLLLSTELKEILGQDGKVKAIQTNTGETIPCQFVGLTAGVRPNVDFLKDSTLELGRGIMINEYFETNLPDVFAIGDCAEFHTPLPDRRPIEQVWYTGKMHGKQVAKNICGDKKKYEPGPWFNSAKFFDIEYHTYGMVMPEARQGEGDFWWEHPNDKIGLHLRWDLASNKFIGLNSFGYRLRHDVFDPWLREGKDIQHVLENLKAANFDPEFYKKHEESIVDAWNLKHPHLAVKLKKKGLRHLIFGRKVST